MNERCNNDFRAVCATAALLALALLASSCEDPITLTAAPEPPPASAEAFVTTLAKAYQQADPELFRSLLANEHGANADYHFLLSEPTDLGETQWDYSEEARIHLRMFRPDQADPPLLSDLWLQSLQITLTPLEQFQERPEFYSADSGADGKLDAKRWRAVRARYFTYVLWDLAGTDYKVEGEANFVVIEDLTKTTGEAGKFLLLLWEDLGRRFALDSQISSESSSWSQIKALYR